MPAVSTDRCGVARITVIHKNQPNMIATITDTISKDGINIANFEEIENSYCIFHLFNVCCADELFRFRSKRNVNGDIICNREKLIKIRS